MCRSAIKSGPPLTARQNPRVGCMHVPPTNEAVNPNPLIYSEAWAQGNSGKRNFLLGEGIPFADIQLRSISTKSAVLLDNSLSNGHVLLCSVEIWKSSRPSYSTFPFI
jgi:hypothetical protein